MNPHGNVNIKKPALKRDKIINNPCSVANLKAILINIVKINKQIPIKLKYGMNLDDDDLMFFHLF